MKVKEVLSEVLGRTCTDAITSPVLLLRHSGAELFETARIASKLVPKADPFVKANTRIYVIGFDAPNCSKTYKAWLEALNDWLDRGADITYFIQHPEADALENLTRIVESGLRSQGKFTICFLKEGASIPNSIKPVLDSWRTSHFALFEHPSQLWYETYHAPGETKAVNCYYFSREQAEQSLLPRQCKKLFLFVLEELKSCDSLEVWSSKHKKNRHIRNGSCSPLKKSVR